MADHTILSEKLEDNKVAVEWGKKQAELMRRYRLADKKRLIQQSSSNFKGCK